MKSGAAFLEVRSSVPGLLRALGFRRKRVSRRAHTHPAVFSITGEHRSNGVRRLPSLYLSNRQVFADRDVSRVGHELLASIAAVQGARAEPTYALHPIRSGDKMGLYGRDLFNRDPYRRKIAKGGVTFSRDRYVVFLGDGRFRSTEWGEFEPGFLVLNRDDPDDPTAVTVTKGAAFPYVIASFRFGMLDPAELRDLIALSERAPGLSSADPAALIRALEEL